jgi:sec-independent protein translocase protein TatA
MAFGLGPTELVVILLIIVIVFGAGRLGTIGGSLGQSIKGFRENVRPRKNEAGTPSSDDENKRS